MELEDLVLVLSLALLVAQALAWRWARGIQKSLHGTYGSDLAKVIAWILGWTLVSRILGIVGLWYYNTTGETDPVLGASIVGQVIAGAVFLWAAHEIWRLRDATPVNRPGEAVAEGDAEPAAEVPPTA